MLALYMFARGHTPEAIGATPKNYLFNLLIGAAFSLWRAVFLADTFRDVRTIHSNQEAFLEKVITDNSIIPVNWAQ